MQLPKPPAAGQRSAALAGWSIVAGIVLLPVALLASLRWLGLVEGLVVWTMAVVLLACVYRQRKAMQALALGARRYQMLFEHMPVMNLVIGLPHGQPTILECNARLAHSLGYGKEELTGRPLRDILLPGSPGQDSTEQDFARILQGQPLVEPRTLQGKDGRALQVLAHIARNVGDPADSASAHATLIDISSSEALRQALLQSEQSFKQLIELIPQFVGSIDAQGRLGWVNQRTLDYLGSAPGQDPADLGWLRAAVHPDDGRRLEDARLQASRTAETSAAIALRLRRHDGDYRWFSCQITPVKDAAGRVLHWIATATDTHDQKLADERRSIVQKMESIGQLTGGLAHDFNNLLAIVIGNLDMVALNPQDGKVPQRVQVALNAAERGAELVKSLLALAAKQPLLPSRTELGALLNRLAPLMRHALGARVQFALQSLAEPVHVEVDVAGLEAALLNLIVNARDAMPKGGELTLALRLHRPQFPHDERSQQLALICVQDSGVGMSEEVRKKATEPFFTTKERGSGTGLGLSMVAGFVKQSGGEMRIQSCPGQGTSVDIFLPLVAAPGARDAATEPAAVATAGSGVVLVIDDEEDVATLMCDWATAAGYTTLRAHTANEALTILATTAVDLLVSDIVMPGPLDGLALAERVNEAYPSLKVLLVSGYSRETASARADLPWPVMVKPFKQPEFQAALQRMLTPVPPPPAADWNP